MGRVRAGLSRAKAAAQSATHRANAPSTSERCHSVASHHIVTHALVTCHALISEVERLRRSPFPENSEQSPQEKIRPETSPSKCTLCDPYSRGRPIVVCMNRGRALSLTCPIVGHGTRLRDSYQQHRIHCNGSREKVIAGLDSRSNALSVPASLTMSPECQRQRENAR